MGAGAFLNVFALGRSTEQGGAVASRGEGRWICSARLDDERLGAGLWRAM